MRHALGQAGVDALHLRLGRRGHLERVGGGLLDDADADHGHAVAAEEQAVLRRAPLHPRHVAEAHQVAVVAARQHQAGEIVRVAEHAFGAHGELAIFGVDTAGRQFQVLGAQRGFHVGHGQVAGGQLAPVQPDAHGVHLAAADPHPRHAVEHRKAVHQIAVRVVGELGDAHAIADQVQPHDHVFVAVDLLDFRRIGFLGQVVEHARHPVADIVGGTVDVAADVELDVDHGAAVFAAGFDETYALDAGDAVFDQFRDAGLDHVGGRARVQGLHRHHRRIDVRVFAQRQAIEGHQAEGDQQQRHHRGEHRPGYRDVGKNHGALLPSPRTAAADRRACCRHPPRRC